MVVDLLDWETGHAFLAAACGIGAEVAQLKREARRGIDEEPFFDDLSETQLATVTTEDADGLFNVGRHLAVIIGDKDAEWRAGEGLEVFLDDLGDEGKGSDMGIDEHARAKCVLQPAGEIPFYDAAVDEPELVAGRNQQDSVVEFEPVCDRKLAEIATGID